MKIANSKCRNYVKDRLPFKANNLFATQEKGLYIVWSYGRHWPLYVHDGTQWFANSERYSVTTSKHKTQANPLTWNTYKTTSELLEMIGNAS